jgi:hypothetical protein
MSLKNLLSNFNLYYFSSSNLAHQIFEIQKVLIGCEIQKLQLFYIGL